MNDKSKSICIGMGQLLVEGGEPERNMERAVEMAQKASDAGCDIFLLPEVFDLAWTHPCVHNEAEPIPGSRCDILTDLARKHNMYICAGLTEKDGEDIYNSAVFINRAGEIILKYRKINLLHVEMPFYKIGESIKVVDTEWGKIGVNICADNYVDSPELGITLGRMGAKIILSPSAWTADYSINESNDPYGDKWYEPYHRLAKMFDLVLVSTTSVGYIVGGPYEGKKMIGCSIAIGKDGMIAEGKRNEFAGELTVCKFEIPQGQSLGTYVGERNTRDGVYKGLEGY